MSLVKLLQIQLGTGWSCVTFIAIVSFSKQAPSKKQLLCNWIALVDPVENVDSSTVVAVLSKLSSSSLMIDTLEGNQ